MSEMLAMRLPADSPEHDSVDQIGRAAEHAAVLKRQLLAFSRQHVLELQVLDLNLLVAETEKMLRRLIVKNVRLITILQPSLRRVRSDPGQINQIIMNLAINAHDAMPEGGSLTVQTRDLELDGRYVLLPAVGELAARPVQSAPVKPVRGSETILLVEDDAPVLKITALLLESLGYRVQEASSGEEALRLAQGSREKIDLLMTDVLMPGMSGPELAEALRDRDADLKVLFHSGHTGDAVAHHGVVYTQVAFLQKPFTVDALSKKLREVLDRC